MVNVIYAFIWLFALWLWGDWRGYKKYYPTILFFMIGDFLYLYLLSDQYPMWRYIPAEVDKEIGVTNVHISLSVMAIKYPATVLIYLGNFPDKGTIKKLLYILLWVGIYAVNELIDLKFNLFTYYNGWSFGWSVLFNAVLFSNLRIHCKKPLIAWILGIVFTLLLWEIFNVPSTVFR